MKYNKIISSALVCALISVMLSGCFPTGEVSVPDSAPEIVEGITINAELPDNTPESAPQLTLRMREWDHDKLTEMLLDGKEISRDNSKFDDQDGVMNYRYHTSDGGWLFFQDGHIDYRSLYPSDQVSVSSYYGTTDMKALFPDEELEDFPKEDALKRVYEIIDKIELGREHLGEPQIYACTAEYANKLSSYIVRSEWTKDDEMYYIRIPVVYNGIPIIDRMFAVMGSSYSFSNGAYVDAVVIRTGVISFRCSSIFDEIKEQGDDIPIKFSAEDAMNQFKNFFSEREFEPLTVVGCTLTYMPTSANSWQEYSFAPAWRIEYYTNPKDGMRPAPKRHIYNANTGVRILDYTG